MPDLFDEFKQERRQAHQRLLAIVSDLTDEQLSWRPGPHAPGIGFHLWHTARWADYDRQIIGGSDQIWQTRNLATTWNLEPALGQTGTGTGMGDDASERLVLPEKGILLAYAEEAFGAFDEFVANLTIEATAEPSRPPDGRSRPVLNVLLTHLAHDSRHLGMIEALKGLLGVTGTATA